MSILCAVLSRSVVSDSLWPRGLQPAGFSIHGDSPGKNSGVGFHALLQVIFSTQGSNPGLPHCRWIIYQLSHQRSPLPIILTRPLPTMSTGPLSTSLLLFLICKQVHLSQLSRFHACVHAKSLQSCPTPCDAMDHSPPGSSVHGILQARILEWVAVPSSKASSRPRNETCISYISCIGRQALYH